MRATFRIRWPLGFVLILLSSCAGNTKFYRVNADLGLLLDKRNQEQYAVARINGKWWTTRNASIALPGSGFFFNPRHNPIGIDGYTYTWQLAQQACPQGWRLPTAEELADLFLAYGKLAYAGDVPYFRKKFGPYEPDSTYATYQAWLNDTAFHLPVPWIMPNATSDREQQTLFWSSDSIGNRAYAVYWDNEQKAVHFAAYPQPYSGFCRCITKDKRSKKQQQKLKRKYAKSNQQEEQAKQVQ